MNKLPSENWLPIAIAPGGAVLEVCVIEDSKVQALVHPVRKIESRWVDAESGETVDIHPTHWRSWAEHR